MTKKFLTRHDLDVALALRVADHLETDIKLNGRATAVVSGGRTPVGFFKQLAEQDIAWDRVSVTLADERWLDASHSDSNERLVREHLLTRCAADASFIPLKNMAASARRGQKELAGCLKQVGMFSVVALATMYIANHLEDVSAIICMTKTGFTPLIMSRINSSMPIYAMAQKEGTSEITALYKGVFPIPFETDMLPTQEIKLRAIEKLRSRGAVNSGDVVLITRGDIIDLGGSTNGLQVIRIED